MLDLAGHLAALAVFVLFAIWALETYTDWRRK